MKRCLWIFAALCIAAGTICLCIAGMRFSALLMVCLAAFFALLAVLTRAAETRRPAKICRNALAILFCAGLACFAALEALVLSGARGDAEGRDVSCVIVLGAGVNGTEPSLMLWARLDAALRYLADKPDVPVIVSGCRGRGENISEAECMYRWLVSHGVAAERIRKEERATSTRTNFAYSYEMLEELGVGQTEDFAFVTNDFHVYRAKTVAGTPRARGVAVRLPRGLYFDALEVNYFVREAFALANELLFRMDVDV